MFIIISIVILLKCVHNFFIKCNIVQLKNIDVLYVTVQTTLCAYVLT